MNSILKQARKEHKEAKVNEKRLAREEAESYYNEDPTQLDRNLQTEW